MGFNQVPSLVLVPNGKWCDRPEGRGESTYVDENDSKDGGREKSKG